MDERLVPLMVVMAAMLLFGVGYVVFSAWSRRRAIAWNVVNAALTLRNLSPEQTKAFEQGLLEALPGFQLTQASLARTEPGVKFALYSIVLRRQGIAPFDPDRPFRDFSSPLLARSVASHIRVARFYAELKHSLVLSELD